MDAASLYKSLDQPDRADHLWRYTPWKRVHPSGDLEDIPITTPAHGTAFDITGKNIANLEPTIQSFKLAIKMAESKFNGKSN